MKDVFLANRKGQCFLLVVLMVFCLAFGLFHYFRHPRLPLPEQFDLVGKQIAHRANFIGTRFPENSIQAITFLLERNVRYLELDVQVTADGVPVIFHDEDLKVFGIDSRIEDVPYVDIRQQCIEQVCDFVPELGKIVSLAKLHQAVIELDIKNIDTLYMEKLVAIVDQHDAYSNVFFSSFYPWLLYKARSLSNRLITAFAIKQEATEHSWANLILRSPLMADFLGVQIIEPDHKMITPERVKAWRDRSLLVNTWTVNDKQLMTEYIKQGFSVTTDLIQVNYSQKE